MKPRTVDISVEGFIGLPGAGKTYSLAVRGLKALEKGRTVYSNFGLAGTIPLEVWDHENIGKTKDPGPSCTCGTCFVSISDAVVLVDEINLWAPSRMWNALPIGLLHRWAQVRKYRTQILWSAQHEDRVDKVIREVTGWMWECVPHRLPIIGGWFTLHAFEPSDMRRTQTRKSLGSASYRLKLEVASAYDTFQIIDFGSQGLIQPKIQPILQGRNEPVRTDPPAPLGLIVETTDPPWEGGIEEGGFVGVGPSANRHPKSGWGDKQP